MNNNFQNNPKVSVVIPVYNASKYIRRAVDSVMIQSNVLEIILVDDGSKDDSLSICTKLQEENSLISLLRHTNFENKGPSATRNLGWQNSKGDWIQFLDADDELLEGKIEGQIKMLKKNIGFIVGNAIDFSTSGKFHHRVANKDPWIGLIIGKLGTSTNLFNRYYLEKVGGFDKELYTSEDYDLMFRILKTDCEIIFDPRFKTKVHQSPNSLSRSKDNHEILLKNWVSLRKRVRLHLIEKSHFNLRHNFYYSGAVGTVQNMFKVKHDQTVNKHLFHLYNFQITLKKYLYKIFNPILGK